MGLMWSFRPVPGSKPGLRMRKMNVQTPMEVTVSVYQGHLTEGFVDQVPLAGVVVERWYMAPGVRRIPITEGGLTATLFLPSGPGPFPGLLDLWGGGGRLVEYRAALLASHGIASLALDYLTPKITKDTGKMVDTEYFETAYRVLEQHPQILGSRIGMLGLSFGTSITFKLAVYSQVVKLRCAVCISGSHVQPIDGSMEQILAFLNKNGDKTRFNEENHVIWRDLLLPIPTDPSLKVDVGRLQCPLLLVVGEDDQNWPAYESAMDMKEMMQRAGNEHLLTVLSYPNTGHLIEPPFTPFARASNFKTVSPPLQTVMVLWGGETVAHSRAQEDAWRKTLVFLRENLYGGSNPGATSLSNLFTHSFDSDDKNPEDNRSEVSVEFIKYNFPVNWIHHLPLLGNQVSSLPSRGIGPVQQFQCDYLIISVSGCLVSQFRMDRKQCCVKLSVQPSRGLMDEKFIVLVQNVLPGSQLTVYAFYQCEGGHSWEAFAHYTANAAGTVNVSEDPSLGGTYSGVEPMGLMWSFRPVPGSKPGLRMRKMNVQTPMEVTVSVYQGHLTEGFVDQVPLAGVVVERWYMAPGVRRIPITEGGLTATLFLPSGPGPFPGLLDLWGGGGRLVEYRAALLASHGIASLALDYLTPKITKDTGKMVDTEYFETAYRVLEQHPQILSSRIGMLGLSFGTSITFKLAVYSQVVKLRCAVCISGSHVQPIDGSMEQILAFLNKNGDKTRFNEENHVICRDLLLPIPTDLSLKVDVGRLQCPLLLVVGEDDQNWPAYESAMDMKEMMQRAGNEHLLTVLSYPNTGHLIEPPFTPFARASNFKTVTPQLQTVMVLWGGETVAHSRAQEDAWRKTLVFLRENLYGGSNPGATSLSNL
ncbi:uncharacterized protein LOC142947931 [Anarhichas minor]|uniref:uncharacterized protein LOC142947931 n=1 Tax=Anarhichas minor TaxID=65739 RepID=UPI003F73C0B2